MAGHADRHALAMAPACLVLLSVALTVALTLGLPSKTLAADVPGNLEGMVASVVREDAEGPVAWARYVETTPDVAAEMLAKRRDQLYEDLPERVYLVVLHGDFSMPGSVEGRGPYLAFLYFRSRDTWQATDFTLLEHPVPLRTVGAPQELEPFALTHPTLDRALLYGRVALFWFLPPLLLVVSAVLVAWKRGSRWSNALAACVAAAVAFWQAFLTVSSISGQSWDPGFHSIKLAVLAVVLAVDLAAIYLLLRRRSRLRAAGEAHPGLPARGCSLAPCCCWWRPSSMCRLSTGWRRPGRELDHTITRRKTGSNQRSNLTRRHAPAVSTDRSARRLCARRSANP